MARELNIKEGKEARRFTPHDSGDGGARRGGSARGHAMNAPEPRHNVKMDHKNDRDSHGFAHIDGKSTRREDGGY